MITRVPKGFKILGLWLGLIILYLAQPGCSKQKNNKIIPTDYSIADHWLSLPAPVKDVDVFYIYPAAWIKTDKSDPDICELNNASMLEGTRNLYAWQASAFEPVGNIYAPYYRQADAGYIVSLHDNERLKCTDGIPAHDVIAAFDYYIRHFNNGRPFILAGHSEGTMVMLTLLPHIVRDPAVYKRMIAAYAIGYPVTQDYMDNNPSLKFAEGPNDTGVIISFNTQSPNLPPGGNPILVSKPALVINPITWTRSETPAAATEGLGSFMPDNHQIRQFSKVPHYADARVDKANGVVICSTADETEIYNLLPSWPKGAYHVFDYALYYYNIRQNAANRTNKFLGK
ncbi:MAG: DUF3089 domain-containing protein [Chlorobiaceae bacterium]